VTAAPGERRGEITIRPAAADDASAVADVYLSAFHATYAFPLAHTDDQVRSWLAGFVGGPARPTWVAEGDGRVIAMMVLDDAGIDQLYVDPAWHGRGIGSALVDVAKAERPGGLQLYTFQVNERARRFYERHGFAATWFGDGSANEEGQPDVRYEWRP
jgi:ribosomal protein S18 acetylase RimI-like enzyme